MVRNLRSIRANSSSKILVKTPQYLLIFAHQKYYNRKSDWTTAKFITAIFKVSESRYKQCGVTQSISTGKIYWKKILRKDKYWHNQLRKAFLTGKNLLKKILGKKLLTQLVEKSFLIDSLNGNNSVCRDSLTLTLGVCKNKYPGIFFMVSISFWFLLFLTRSRFLKTICSLLRRPTFESYVSLF